jgi:hypothetical protein
MLRQISSKSQRWGCSRKRTIVARMMSLLRKIGRLKAISPLALSTPSPASRGLVRQIAAGHPTRRASEYGCNNFAEPGDMCQIRRRILKKLEIRLGELSKRNSKFSVTRN